MKKTFIKFVLSEWTHLTPIIVITIAMLASFIVLSLTEGLEYGLGFGIAYLLIDILIIYKTYQRWKWLKKNT